MKYYSCNWCGFYFKRMDKKSNKDVLVLGPFQGKSACIRIQYGKGVCGSSWKELKTIIVKDVHKFPGHIACDSLYIIDDTLAQFAI